MFSILYIIAMFLLVLIDQSGNDVEEPMDGMYRVLNSLEDLYTDDGEPL